MGLMAAFCVRAFVPKVIRIVEAVSREGMPLRKAEHTFYLDRTLFRITNCAVQDTTQIHTQTCYSNFSDIIHSIINMDADVINIEKSWSISCCQCNKSSGNRFHFPSHGKPTFKKELTV